MITALFVTEDSIYKKLGIDSYDLARNATTYAENNVVICHPPCRTWGQLSHFSKGTIQEHNYAYFCVDLIRKNGGILEHPKASRLFKEHLPKPGFVDLFGGFTLNIDQSWFGHKAKKSTNLYFCGITPRELPIMPIKFDAIEYTVGSNSRTKNPKKEITKKERLDTPIELAKWIIQAANIIAIKKQKGA